MPNNIRFKIHGLNYQAPVWGEYKEILSKSKMALNLNGEEGWPLYSSDRIAQLMGNGILTFLWNKGMKNLIRDEQAVFFDSKEDLLEKVLYYHTHDKERKKLQYPVIITTTPIFLPNILSNTW